MMTLWMVSLATCRSYMQRCRVLVKSFIHSTHACMSRDSRCPAMTHRYASNEAPRKGNAALNDQLLCSIPRDLLSVMGPCTVPGNLVPVHRAAVCRTTSACESAVLLGRQQPFVNGSKTWLCADIFGDCCSKRPACIAFVSVMHTWYACRSFVSFIHGYYACTVHGVARDSRETISPKDRERFHWKDARPMTTTMHPVI
jgi:hypothetical protein